jgi:hypothetical protein
LLKLRRSYLPAERRLEVIGAGVVLQRGDQAHRHEDAIAVYNPWLARWRAAPFSKNWMVQSPTFGLIIDVTIRTSTVTSTAAIVESESACASHRWTAVINNAVPATKAPITATRDNCCAVGKPAILYRSHAM